MPGPEAVFMVGDVITIDNADRPAWVDGYWRVVGAQQKSDGWYVELVPLRDDAKTIDGPRAARGSFWITPNGPTVMKPREH